MKPRSPYANEIARIVPGYDPRLIEAYVRMERGTLDQLSAADLRREVRIAAACIDADPVLAEELAQSFGL